VTFFVHVLLLVKTEEIWEAFFFKMIEIDGSCGEGGGQVLRTAVSFSAVVGGTCPGMQHKGGPREAGPDGAASLICSGRCRIVRGGGGGGFFGFGRGCFFPRKDTRRKLLFRRRDRRLCHACSAVSYAACFFAPGRVSIEVCGGTDVRWSPSVDYIIHVFLPVIHKFGCSSSISLLKRVIILQAAEG